MAVPAMAAMIATSTARSAAAKNAEKETNKKKLLLKNQRLQRCQQWLNL